MVIIYSPKFKKCFNRLSPKIQGQFFKRLKFFLENPQHSLLKNHKLHGLLSGSWAFSITGDIRAVYQFIDEKTIKLTNIGTHSQVY